MAFLPFRVLGAAPLGELEDGPGRFRPAPSLASRHCCWMWPPVCEALPATDG